MVGLIQNAAHKTRLFLGFMQISRATGQNNTKHLSQNGGERARQLSANEMPTDSGRDPQPTESNK